MATPVRTVAAVHFTVNNPLPGVTVSAVGEFGRSSGVTEFDAALAVESPTAERAFTLNV